MSSVAVIIYSVYLISSRNEKKISKYILVLFIIIVFLKSSATLLAGTIFSILAIFILEYKKLGKYKRQGWWGWKIQYDSYNDEVETDDEA